MADRLNPYKLVVFGSGAVGKSSVTLRFVTNTFTPEYLPTIEDCYRKNCMVDDETVFLDILDTAGQEEYTALRDQWTREGKAFILVYSITSRATFEDVSAFKERIQLVHEDQVMPMVLVGNKVDLENERVVSTKEGEEMAAKLGRIPFIECSALTGLNCTQVFFQAVREIRRFEKLKVPKAENKKSKKKFCMLL